MLKTESGSLVYFGGGLFLTEAEWIHPNFCFSETRFKCLFRIAVAAVFTILVAVVILGVGKQKNHFAKHTP